MNSGRDFFSSDASFRDYVQAQVVQQHPPITIVDKKTTSMRSFINMTRSQKQMADQQLNEHRQHSMATSGQLINRKALFDKSREGLSLKKQIPLSKVKEYLKGAGKNATNADFAVGESARMFDSLQNFHEDQQMLREAAAVAKAARDSISDCDFAEQQHHTAYPNIKIQHFSRNMGE